MRSRTTSGSTTSGCTRWATAEGCPGTRRAAALRERVPEAAPGVIGRAWRVSSGGGRELGRASVPPSLRSGSGGPAVRPSPHRPSLTPTPSPSSSPAPSSRPPSARARSRAAAAAVTVSALAAALAGCMSVSDPEEPKPSGSTARHDGKDGWSGPNGVTVDGRGDGPRRLGRDGAAHPAGGKGKKAGKASKSAAPEPSEPGTPSRPVRPSGPEPGAGGAHGGSGGHGGRPHPEPTPTRPDRPATPPASSAPSTPPRSRPRRRAAPATAELPCLRPVPRLADGVAVGALRRGGVRGSGRGG